MKETAGLISLLVLTALLVVAIHLYLAGAAQSHPAPLYYEEAPDPTPTYYDQTGANFSNYSSGSNSYYPYPGYYPASTQTQAPTPAPTVKAQHGYIIRY